MGLKFGRGLDHAKEFEQLICAIARSKGQHSHLLAEAKRSGSELIIKASQVQDWSELAHVSRDPSRRERVEVAKTAISAGTLTDATWAGPLAALSPLSDAWFASLRNLSMLDAIVSGGMMNAPPGRKFPITAAIGSGYTVADAYWVPLTKFDFDLATAQSLKAMGLVVVSDDMLKFGGALAENTIGAQMRKVVSQSADAAVVAVLIAGLNSITSSMDAREDLRLAFDVIQLSQDSRPIIFAAPNLTKQMALDGLPHSPPCFPDMQVVGGGSIGGVPVLAIDALTDYSTLGDCMIVCDATQLAGRAGAIDITASNEANIQMVDNPTGAASMVSMFQTNSTALRSTRWFNVDRVRTTAVALVEGCNYISGSSP
jgi:hypothetical protein